MRTVVLDVNVLVSSLITPTGNAARIVDAWRRNELAVIASAAIVGRVTEVLHRPHLLNSYPYGKIDVAAVRTLKEEEGLATPGELDLRVVEDPEDDSILIAAVEGRADCIISGDPHLRNLGTYQGIPILTPAEFVEQYHIPLQHAETHADRDDQAGRRESSE